MSEAMPQPSGSGAPQARERQTAIAPLNTLALEDTGGAAKTFDAWLRKVTNHYVTLERLLTVAGSVPVVGNLMAVGDAIVNVVEIVGKYDQKQPVEVLDWAGLGINLVGAVPAPGTTAARMSLRPVFHLVKQELRKKALVQGVANGLKQDIGATLVAVLIDHLNDEIAGDFETFVQKAMGLLKEILDKCAAFIDELCNNLIDVLRRCRDNQPLVDLRPPPKPPKRLRDPRTDSTFERMLAAAKEAAEEFDRTVSNTAIKAVNTGASAALYFLDEADKQRLNTAIAQLTDLKQGFRSATARLCDTGVEMSMMWMLVRLMQALANRKKRGGSVSLNAEKGAQHHADKPGGTVDGTNSQVPPRQAPNDCKACASKSKTGGSISFATGAESFTHTDFVLNAALPIEWSRTYRSDLGAYDQGPLGARWLTPYSTRVDVQGEGRHRGLVYHGADGRSHRYPWLEVGQSHRDPVEEITLTRLTEGLLVLDFGKPKPEGQPSDWRESYELVDTCAAKVKTHGRQHFRLAALHGTHGASIGLRYDHHVAGEQVLSDIVSKQGEATLAHVGVQPDAESGRILTLWEIKDGQLVRQLAAYDYDPHGDLIQAQDENAAAWRYEYQYHLVTRYTDRTGRGMNLRYDGTGVNAKAVHEWADDRSFETRLEWDRNIRLTYVTDALGQETWVYYDIDGYPYRTIHPDQREEWFFRDNAKNLTRHVHPDGSADHYRYDEHGNLIQHVRADGSRVHFEYDTAHRLTGVMDPDGGVWRRDYDPQGRLTEETDPRGNKTQYAYDKAGRPTKVTDAKGGTKKLAYTASGQLARYTDCSGRTTQWEYDAQGRLVKSIDATGQETRYRYTPVTAETLHRAQQAEDRGNHPGQLEALIYADDSEDHLCHDAEGRLLIHTDALKRTTAYSYTAAGLVRQRIDALGQRLGYRWDRLGRLAELRNENDQPYSFRYDPVGQLLAETGFDGKTTEYRYDDATGILQAVVDGSVTTQLEFDPMGRLLQRKAKAPGRDEQVESFTYYPGGQLCEAKNEHAKLQWFYDPAGNLVREHHHYHGEHFPEKCTAVWHHRYDEMNQRVGTTRPDGHKLEWLTYGSGHVHGLVLDGQDVLGFERDALHREVYRSQGNGLEQSQRYDPVGRLLEQQVKPSGHRMPVEMDVAYKNLHNGTGSGAAAILRRYRYDKAGQLDHIEDSRRGRLEYRYDPVGRLLQATSVLGKEVFAFDPAGNIAPAHDPDAAQRPSGPRAVPKLLDNLLKEYAGTSYRYDERGNLVERVHFGQRSGFAWDAFNRMTKANTPEGNTSFAYDPLGRRILKRSERNNPHGGAPLVETTVFGWDGDTLAFESRQPQGQHSGQTQTVHYIHEPGGFVPLLQARRSGAVQLCPTTDVKALMTANGGEYHTELDPLWNGELEAEAVPFDKAEIVFYQCDHLGTPQELTDHEGKIAWAAQYKAWGLAKAVIGEAARKAGLSNPIRFQGQYFDEETGLHYNRYRYYDPVTGRFASKDPIGLIGGTNLHEFAPNTTAWTDPLGLARSSKAGRYHGKKPKYTNPGHHDPSSGGFRGSSGGRKTSVLPCHHEELAKRSIPDADGHHWYAVDELGVYHRFGNSNDGTMHWNGDSTQNGGFPVPPAVKKRLDQIHKDGKSVKRCKS
ncbi:RHS repeat-associated core domain-containing protein [Caldimonas brevitalea]|uniref:Type IV secretion protein Rhs n=1 Tax=Caldimonas brevitalea TaxID=413882 RepID=A0A0G3BMC3_9BURK|nr:RHS repeat-associated core domain-containing protein [Caldimonas brevitalea]AKJ28506.1 type IV secretion protein Rhs [Caldimonas brevitalea]